MKRAPAELLAPAGDWDCLRAAAANGADAVYFGLPKFNARLRAENFTEADLPEVMRFLRRQGLRGYVTCNTLVFTAELEDAVAYLQLLERHGVDAVLIQDVGLALAAAEFAPSLEIHASTQMTLTSPEGIAFAKRLGVRRAVLARELSLRELGKFPPGIPLEVFVHGALCVAYSGQCLTSEVLGQRSANRGECAQACRLPYRLIVDGALRDLGDKRYLLSPQDLAAIDDIPALVQLGIASFKIEGRLKSPEYVAAVTRVYRKAIDAALAKAPSPVNARDRYELEMTFSRGLYPGWLHGVNHQELVGARFGKKRGPFAGRVRSVGKDFVRFDPQTPLAPGDGIVFDSGKDTDHEVGGRIYSTDNNRFKFGHGQIDFTRVKPGDRVWKTSDPQLERTLRQTYTARLEPKRQPVNLRVTGGPGRPLLATLDCAGRIARAESDRPLDLARNAPLTEERLREHLGRFGEAPYRLDHLEIDFDGPVILPIGQLNALRRKLLAELDRPALVPRALAPSLAEITRIADAAMDLRFGPLPAPPATAPILSALCRSDDQLEAALGNGLRRIYVDFEDIRRYAGAVERAHAFAARIYLATPRIQKAGEERFFKLIAAAGPDGVLLRNLGAISFFASSGLDMVGDYSLNVSNPIGASLFLRCGLSAFTVSYDLDARQVLDLLRHAPAERAELVIHQHLPMFHMEHCVFAAFMGDGTDHTNCGRPCDLHRVHLRDRVGTDHPLRADAGCRNTLYHAVPQTGARFFDAFRQAGARQFRVEFLQESREETARILGLYRDLMTGKQDGHELWRNLKACSQLGVTSGPPEGE